MARYLRDCTQFILESGDTAEEQIAAFEKLKTTSPRRYDDLLAFVSLSPRARVLIKEAALKAMGAWRQGHKRKQIVVSSRTGGFQLLKCGDLLFCCISTLQNKLSAVSQVSCHGSILCRFQVCDKMP
jgi:hypothetical protein